uniref:AA_permease domain-containing protein n=1 Tax=Steinernema glaseri TaxID=37863 RepID=A0A1I7ZZS8_9BILA
MTNLDQGPINFQAACKDSLFAHLKYFGKDNGPNSLPRRAYIFMSCLTMVLVLIGDLNVVNDIVSNLFLATYALVNYACFDASFARSPGWRPQFPYYNMWLSLFGAALCVVIMFVLSVWKTLLIAGLFALTMLYMHRRGLEVNWGDTSQAHAYRNALVGLSKITNHADHVKNYRPQILLMTGNPASRPALVDFANSITKGDSLLISAHVVPYPQCERIFSLVRNLEVQMTDWMKAMKVRAFYQPLANEDLRRGMQNLLQISGLGKLRPNILFCGWKEDWAAKGRDGIDDVDNYVGILSLYSP